MDPKRRIQKRAAHAFHTEPENVVIVKRLLGGMSHLTYHISIGGNDYTYRIIGQGGNRFVDRRIEYENIKRIEPLGLNNETVYFDVETGEKAARYVPGLILSEVDVTPYLFRVAQALKKLHESGIEPVNDYAPIERLERYESYTTERSEQYRALKKAWIERYRSKHASEPRVFCHNDAQRSNMVVADDRFYLLDWEYAGKNPIYYDIASFGNVRFDDALALLDVYLGRPASEEEKDRVRFYRMFQALQWHQVASYKKTIGLSEVVGFNFKDLAASYLELADRLYRSIEEW
ncbi:MAG: phosphotransferase [Acholeplasmataceae bacterium]